MVFQENALQCRFLVSYIKNSKIFHKETLQEEESSKKQIFLFTVAQFYKSIRELVQTRSSMFIPSVVPTCHYIILLLMHFYKHFFSTFYKHLLIHFFYKHFL